MARARDAMPRGQRDLRRTGQGWCSKKYGRVSMDRMHCCDDFLARKSVIRFIREPENCTVFANTTIFSKRSSFHAQKCIEGPSVAIFQTIWPKSGHRTKEFGRKVNTERRSFGAPEFGAPNDPKMFGALSTSDLGHRNIFPLVILGVKKSKKKGVKRGFDSL